LNRKLLLLMSCGLLLAVLIPGVTAQDGGCSIDIVQLNDALAGAEAAAAAGDLAATMVYLTEIRTMLDRMDPACRGDVNWCYAGEPWGDGRCNAAGLTPEQVSWYWDCGWYWAQAAHGLRDTVPGDCGGDRDGDGLPDNDDLCPDAGGSIDAGGCPVSDVVDACPADPNKTAPGACGCGIPDVDVDGDGTLDCVDLCTGDPNKNAPGVCGCGVADVDTDGDGTYDCHDSCPADPGKIAPGVCGCGVVDGDTDGDGTHDCHDNCPTDPGKTDPGVCGCGLAESNNCDGDGLDNSADTCPLTSGTMSCSGCPEGCSGFGCSYIFCLYSSP
jgi:hypothetical protein